jgi:flagellar biosynthesis/type III secretory pathway protein FliH
VQDVELTWADRVRLEGVKEGRREGLQEGLQEGLLRGKRETLKRLLASRFGPLSVRAESRIDALASVEELDSCFDRGLTAGSLAELGLDG